MKIGAEVPDLSFYSGPNTTVRLSDWDSGPLVLIFLRHLA